MFYCLPRLDPFFLAPQQCVGNLLRSLRSTRSTRVSNRWFFLGGWQLFASLLAEVTFTNRERFIPPSATVLRHTSFSLSSSSVSMSRSFEDYLTHYVGADVELTALVDCLLKGATDTKKGHQGQATALAARNAPSSSPLGAPSHGTLVAPVVTALIRGLQGLQLRRMGLRPRRTLASLLAASIPTVGLAVMAKHLRAAAGSTSGGNGGHYFTMPLVAAAGGCSERKATTVPEKSTLSTPQGLFDPAAAASVGFPPHELSTPYHRSIVILDVTTEDGHAVRQRRCLTAAATICCLLQANQRVFLLPLTRRGGDRHSDMMPYRTPNHPMLAQTVRRSMVDVAIADVQWMCKAHFDRAILLHDAGRAWPDDDAVDDIRPIVGVAASTGEEGKEAAAVGPDSPDARRRSGTPLWLPPFTGTGSVLTPGIDPAGWPYNKVVVLPALGQDDATERPGNTTLIERLASRTETVVLESFSVMSRSTGGTHCDNPFDSIVDDGNDDDDHAQRGGQGGHGQSSTPPRPGVASNTPQSPRSPGARGGGAAGRRTLRLRQQYRMSQHPLPRVSVTALPKTVPRGSLIGVGATVDTVALALLLSGPPPDTVLHASSRRRVLLLGDVNADRNVKAWYPVICGLAALPAVADEHRVAIDALRGGEGGGGGLDQRASPVSKNHADTPEPDQEQAEGGGHRTASSAASSPATLPGIVMMAWRAFIQQGAPSLRGIMEHVTSLFDDIVLFGDAAVVLREIEKEAAVDMRSGQKEDVKGATCQADASVPPSLGDGAGSLSGDFGRQENLENVSVFLRTCVKVLFQVTSSRRSNADNATAPVAKNNSTQPQEPGVSVAAAVASSACRLHAAVDFSLSRRPPMVYAPVMSADVLQAAGNRPGSPSSKRPAADGGKAPLQFGCNYPAEGAPLNPLPATKAATQKRTVHVVRLGEDQHVAANHHAGHLITPPQSRTSSPSKSAAAGASVAHEPQHETSPHSVCGLGPLTAAMVASLLTDACFVACVGELALHPALQDVAPEGLVGALASLPAHAWGVACGNGPLRAFEALWGGKLLAASAGATGGACLPSPATPIAATGGSSSLGQKRSSERFLATTVPLSDVLCLLAGSPVAAFLNLPDAAVSAP